MRSVSLRAQEGTRTFRGCTLIRISPTAADFESPAAEAKAAEAAADDEDDSLSPSGDPAELSLVAAGDTVSASSAFR